MREALATTLVTSGAAGLLSLGVAKPRPTLVDADLTLTSVFLVSLVAIAIGGWLFFTIVVAANRFKRVMAQLVDFQRSGINLFTDSLQVADDLQLNALKEQVNDWDSEVRTWLDATYPHLTGIYLMSGGSRMFSNLTYAGASSLANSIRNRVDNLNKLIIHLTRDK